MAPLDAEVAARAQSRIKTNGSSLPRPSITLSSAHVSEALKRSPDNGATIDLSRQNITEVGDTGAQDLANIGTGEIRDENVVLRIALGSNRLTTLPIELAVLSRLRYLNLKNNSFLVFPEVLTTMSSLDTLDISHNKIKRLPSNPGSLVNLRVFCFSRNNVVRLPSYISKFHRLDILKCERNPIEWPPRTVMESTTALTSAQTMKDWIRSLQKWIENNAIKSELPSVSPNTARNDQLELEISIDEHFQSWSPFLIGDKEFDAGVTPHARSFSRDSNFSTFSITESPQELETPVSSSLPLTRSHLHIPSYSTSTSPSRSPDRWFPSPDGSADEGFSAVSNFVHQLHARNASLTTARSPRRADRLAKQSMPDLRTAKLNFQKKSAVALEQPHANGRDIPSGNKSLDDISTPSPPSQRPDYVSLDDPPLPKPLPSDPTESPTTTDRLPPMDIERNSYFRRLSAIPASTTSSTLPAPLFNVVDSVRTILFAVCQVYQTLQHYTVYAIDDRLSSVLRKVLDPASSDMMQLINSLDRFDGISRKTLPSPALCRSVVEGCKDTIAVFGKAVGVLTLQLKVLATRDDVRYLRQMLLVLYGATAEISHAWLAILPHVEAVKPLLRDHRPIPVSKPHSAIVRPPPLLSEHTPSSTPTSATIFPQDKPYLLRSHQTRPLEDGVGRTHTARRHAGSFSSKDVEIGKQLPSYDDPPFLSAGVITGPATKTPILRVAKRYLGGATPTSAGLPPPMPSGSAVRPHLALHSRRESQVSLHGPSSSLSPKISSKVQFMDLPLNSKSLVDKEALDAMKLAVEAAPAVWETMSDILADVLESNVEVRENLSLAKILTKRLGKTILAVQQGDIAADKKSLRDDAHVFVKTVVQLSNVIKAYGASHSVPSDLRSKMVKLTNSTEEFVILLHVSSFTPSSTLRSYSPVLSASAAPPSSLGLPGGSEEARLGPSLSRSRSAQPPSSLKLTTLAADVPRSALPHQYFRIPAIQRAQEAGDVPG